MAKQKVTCPTTLADVVSELSEASDATRRVLVADIGNGYKLSAAQRSAVADAAAALATALELLYGIRKENEVTAKEFQTRFTRAQEAEEERLAAARAQRRAANGYEEFVANREEAEIAFASALLDSTSR